MIITTTPTIEGRPVQEYLGLVSGECVLLGGIFDNFADVEDRILEARHRAQTKLTQRAAALGANAVVGVRVDMEIQGGVKYVQVTGTAVVVP